jgi:hypothetical protein
MVCGSELFKQEVLDELIEDGCSEEEGLQRICDYTQGLAEEIFKDFSYMLEAKE